MANARRQRTSTHAAVAKTRSSADPRHAATSHRPRANTRAGKQGHAGLPWWAIPLTILVVGLGSLVAWRAFRTTAGDGTNIAANARPIATLDAPDSHSLLIDAQDPDHVLFGSHAGIQESRDGGFTWEAGALRDADAMQMASSPNSPETLYATGHDVFQVSRDGGQSWQQVAHDLPGTDIHGFAQDPADPNRLYAFVAGAGTFTSTDGGTTWTALPVQPPGGGMHLALAASDTALYAATGAGLVSSTDHGATWIPLPSQPSGQVLSLAIPTGDAQTIYVGTPSGIEVSPDGGASWASYGPRGVAALALAVAPTDPGRVVLVSATGDVYRSDTAGTTWRSPGD